jgi:release factor glutamine methyltransferase
MQTVKETYKELCKKLPELEARISLEERAGVSWSSIIADGEKEIDENAYKAIKDDLETRLSGKPLSKIYGKKEFWGREFIVNEHTLDPRPDSETLIELALKYYKDKEPPKTILDLGTGTGCLLLTLLSEFKGARGVGIDISEEALKIANQNAEALNLTDRVSFSQGEWAESITDTFDLVISNPPYIASDVIPNLEKEVKIHDPILALDGGFDGLQAYEDIFSDLSRILKDDGMALFEIGFDQGDEMMRLSKKYEIRIGNVHPDLAGNPRVVDIFKN